MKTLALQSMLKIPKEQLIRRIEKTATMKGDGCWLFMPENREGKVCIVAHIDTVWDGGRRDPGTFESLFGKEAGKESKKKPEREKVLIHDKEKGIIWSPDGLGADDRAGVYAALKLFKEIPEPYKPFVLLTDYEETGGQGAREAAKLFKSELEGCNFFIELDRMNGNDAVFYNYEPAEFEEYITGFGFKKAGGSFSDISFICPAVRRCGVNLSIGYYNQHTEREYLVTGELYSTIEKVMGILKDNHEKGKIWELETRSIVEMLKSLYGFDHKDTLLFDDMEAEGLYDCPECGGLMAIEDVDYSQGYCVMCGAFLLDGDEPMTYSFR